MINESFHYLKKKMKNDIQEIEVLFIYLSLLAIIWLKNNNNNKTKFSYKIDCSFKLQTHSISFYWR